PLEADFNNTRHTDRQAAGGFGYLNGWDHRADGSTAPWSTSGESEVDCLMCHLAGYDFLERSKTIRFFGSFESAASVGAGFGQLAYLDSIPDVTGTSAVTGQAISYRKNAVLYNAQTVDVQSDGSVWFDMNGLQGTPGNTNCAFCHASTEPAPGDGFYSVKAIEDDVYVADTDAYQDLRSKPRKGSRGRGFYWGVKQDIHTGIGCKGCHMNTGKAPVKGDGTGDTTYLNERCSPGKSVDPWLTAHNDNDETVLYCQDCHITHTAPYDYGAPDPRYAHEKAGLTEHMTKV
ncbi:MAG: hypothetical protein GWN87_12725, partial [Desulfuromonadales bacterium]|nr:hypothetical protein [Desulfuromonadales bacterium]